MILALGPTERCNSVNLLLGGNKDITAIRGRSPKNLLATEPDQITDMIDVIS